MKYTFDVPVVAMVSNIPGKSSIAINYVRVSHMVIGKGSSHCASRPSTN